MFIKTLDTGIVEIYPFETEAELTPNGFFGGRVEVFPESYRNDGPLQGKRVRWESVPYTREEWNERWTKINEAMQKAFEIEAATSLQSATRKED